MKLLKDFSNAIIIITVSTLMLPAIASNISLMNIGTESESNQISFVISNITDKNSLQQCWSSVIAPQQSNNFETGECHGAGMIKIQGGKTSVSSWTPNATPICYFINSDTGFIIQAYSAISDANITIGTFPKLNQAKCPKN